MKQFIDKLIGRLEEYPTYSFGVSLLNTKEYIKVSDLKEIVNQLAEEYSGDFCEWKKENSNKYVCNSHAEIHDSRVLDWCVCPYCGKKIRVAPYQPKGE